MDFPIQIYGSIRITDNITIYITETLLVTWIIISVLAVLAIIVNIMSKKWEAMTKPTGVQNFAEMAVGTFDNFFKSSSSKKVLYLAPWFFTVFVFILISNMIGLIGLRPPTADWGMTFPLAASSFLLFQFAGLWHRPKGYLKSFFEPNFLFLPLNLLGEIAKPIALSFRLFGNVLAGVILISLLYGMAPIFFRFGFPVFLHAYFDIFSGILQAFVFTVLSITFVGLAAES